MYFCHVFLNILLLLLSYIAGFDILCQVMTYIQSKFQWQSSSFIFTSVFILKHFTLLQYPKWVRGKQMNTDSLPELSRPAHMQQGAAFCNKVKLWPGCGNGGKLLL